MLVTVQVLFSKCEEVVVTVLILFAVEEAGVGTSGAVLRVHRARRSALLQGSADDARSEGFFGEKAVTKGRVRCFSTWSEQRAKAARLRMLTLPISVQ
jgi:hypothetical protein